MGDDQIREFEEFRTQCRAAVGQQVNGHTEPFQALWSHADDVVLMGAAGGHAIGWQDVSASLRWASEHLDFTDWHAESLLTKINDDFALTCDLEHMRHEVNGEVQQRTLRVSQGYRYEEGQWRIMFRHGDPMAERITPPEVTRS